MEKKIEVTVTKRDWIKALIGATVGIGGGIVTGKIMKAQYEQNNATIESVVELAGYIGMMLAGGGVAATAATAIADKVCKGIDKVNEIGDEVSKPEPEEVIEEDETDEEEEEA